MSPRRRDQLARALGARIRALRAEVGLTQEKLAWDSDLAKAYLSQVEAGKRTPSIPVLCTLAERLGVEAADILALDLEKPRLRRLDAARRRDQKAIAVGLRQVRAPGTNTRRG